MKRALSLILVLAMVLCLVPFSAFAEGEEWGFGGVYEDGTITLNADNNYEASALYTAPDAGTVTFSVTVLTEGVEGVNVYINGSETAYDGSEISVAADGTVDVTVSSDNSIECEVSISHNFMTLPGTEGNPRYLSSNNTTVIVPANGEVWYNLYGAGYIVSVSQGLEDDVVDFTVYHKNSDATYAPDAENWIYDAQFNGVGTRYGGADVIKITNNLDVPMYYLVKMIAPEGHMANPMPIYFVDEAIEGEVMAGSQGFYYTYTPYQDGTLTVTVGATDAEGTACGWTYTVNNLTSYAYGDTQWSDSDPVVNPAVIEVSANDEIQIIVNTYDPADPWNAPAGKVSVTLGFEAAPEEPDVPVTPAEPVVAKHNGVEMGLTAAIAAAASSDVKTVELIADVDMPDATIIIEPGVILDTKSFDMTVKYLIGLSGSSLQNTATRYNGTNLDAAGKINVAKNNMILSETTVNPNSSTKMKVMPFWLPESSCYTLGNFRMNDDKGAVTFENDGVYYTGFYHQGAGTLNANVFADNGSTDHGIRMVIRTEWTAETGAYTNDYTYLDSFVKLVASGSGSYGYTLNGLVEVLAVDMSTFKLTPMIITDCGAIYYGNTIEYSAE